MLFGTVVPEMVGVVVTVPLFDGLRIAMVGEPTAVKLTGTAVLPPGPMAVTVSVFGPDGTATGQANVPATVAVVEQSVTVPGPVGFGAVITIGVPAGAVPETVGVVVVNGPIGSTTSDGGFCTTVNVVGVLTLPDGFEAVTVSVFVPVGRVVLSVQANVPTAEAVVVQSVTGPGPVITI